MTPAQRKLALKLYRQYKTETTTYRKLAQELGLDPSELNRWCWHLSKGQGVPAAREVRFF